MATIAHSVPTIDLDPFDPETLHDPYPFYEILRDTGPIFFLSVHQSYGVAQFDALSTVFNDTTSFISSGGAGLSDIRKPGAWREPGPIVEADPPQHTRIRKAVQQVISPRVVRGWREAFTEAANELCDALAAGPENIDVVPDVAEAYVFKVFPAALGIEVDCENLIIVGNHNFNSLGPQNALFQKSLGELDRIREWYERTQQRTALIPGGFGELLFEAEESGALPAGTASPLIRTFLRGGMDTTISAIGSLFRNCAQSPELWETLQGDGSKILPAFEETIRLEAPAQTLFRTTSPAGAELAGHRLLPDTKVQLFVGAANRDPRKWDRPDEFDLTRKAGAHASFGLGIHNCVGRMIAHLEAECLMRAFLDRFKRVELAGEPKIRLLNALRTHETLPMRIIAK